GRMVTVGGTAGQRSPYEEAALAAKGQWVRQTSVFNEAQAAPDQKGWAQIKKWFEDGSLQTIVQKVFPWTEAEAAQKLLADRGVFGKIVMTVG
ncbi:MAG: zinc-binding dehydrogenase, partial [Chloroflexi bacterium]|nr:zinc-binding dehydrogenase [Chloroflexota bacterium]